MAMGTTGMTVLPPVKSVMVYRNGDPFHPGRRFVVNQRQVATMEAFLTEVTQSIGAPLAIRTLYTPRQGHRVTDFEDLRTGAQYVAAGFEKFKKLDYLNPRTKKQPAAHEETQAKVIQRPNVSAKWRKFIPVPCILHVFRNGDLLCPPFRFIIPRSMRQELEQILSLITEKVSLRTGAVRRLCSVEGVTVSSAAELETGRCYVAVGTERFKKLPYVELLLSKATERQHPGKRKLMRRNENRKVGPEDQYSDSALLDSPELNGLPGGRRVKSTGDEAAPPSAAQQGSSGEGTDENTAFFAKPVKIRNNRRQPRPPLVNGFAQPSVFKRAARKRREEVRGATEVHEDENTVTELPVDQRAAETVEDEEIANPTDPLHGTEQSDEQITKRGQQSEEGRLRKHHHKQASEDDGVNETGNTAKPQESSAETPETRTNHVSPPSRPLSASQGKNEKDKVPQGAPSVAVGQNRHQEEIRSS